MDLDNDAQCGFEIVTARDIDEYGPKGVIRKLKDRVGDGNVYITVDIDVLDPVREPSQAYMQLNVPYGRTMLTLSRTHRRLPQPLAPPSPVAGPPVSF